ncbi:MAG: 16S rRNA (adenine1518-N6/adenine1519-N6)-dimethyltransferase [Planctomycetota bacterium]|jgi:16S rRNA (adenine1518-N6/adenine1519-N6)-dimethyltransferase
MQAKKSLGQNFLNSETITRQIVTIADPQPGVIVLEIGPGKGALTREILPFVSKLIAVEADIRMTEILEGVFPDAVSTGTLEIVHDDIMDWNETQLREYDKKYQIIANIPYYLTGILLRKFLTSTYPPNSITFVVQKEIADRIMARDKKHSLLSLSVQVFGIPSMPLEIPRHFFTPIPKVDSAVIHIADISHKRFTTTQEQDSFFTLIRAGFAHKRKTLANNLKELIAKPILEGIFQELGHTTRVRAEDLSLDDWFRILEYTPT